MSLTDQLYNYPNCRLRLDNLILSNKLQHIYNHLGLQTQKWKENTVEEIPVKGYMSNSGIKDKCKPIKKVKKKVRKTSRTKKQKVIIKRRFYVLLVDLLV